MAGSGFAAYPMVGEEAATGRVAAVYADVLDVLPFVPSLFKSLATNPAYLVLAWGQAKGVVGGDSLRRGAADLAVSVADATSPPLAPAVRAALGRFALPLAKMLVVCAGLAVALEGRIAAPPAPAEPPPHRPLPRSGPQVPSPQEAGDELVFGAIRLALDTPIINSIWRVLSRDGLLEEAWGALAGQVEATRPAADAVEGRAVAVAVELPWTVVAAPPALDAAGIGDAAPGMAAILDAYLRTLPRVLVLVASSGR